MDATDLDAVLENISLLIEDMEDNINETKVIISLRFFQSRIFFSQKLKNVEEYSFLKSKIPGFPNQFF